MTNDSRREQAGILLRKAREDDHPSRTLAGDSQASAWIIGFHCQQAVEKCIKAVLAAHGVRYPFTHDIEALVKLARNNGLVFPPNTDDLPRLTPFAALARYDDEDDTDATTFKGITADWLLTCSAQALRWAEQQLGNV